MPEDTPSGGSKPDAVSISVSQSGWAPRTVLELDHVYEALGHKRRRYLCYTLLESTQWSPTELAAKVAAYENGCLESAVTTDQRKRVSTSLAHVHVPKLADEDVIRFDGTDEMIRPGPNARQVLLALEGMEASVDSEREEHTRSEIDDDEA